MKNLLIISCCLLAHFMQAQSQMELLQPYKNKNTSLYRLSSPNSMRPSGSRYEVEKGFTLNISLDKDETISKVTIIYPENKLTLDYSPILNSTNKKEENAPLATKEEKSTLIYYFKGSGYYPSSLTYIDGVFYDYTLPKFIEGEYEPIRDFVAFSDDKSKLDKLKKDKERKIAIQKVTAYLNEMHKKLEAYNVKKSEENRKKQEEIEAAKKKLEEEKQEQKSIQNKDIAKIEVVWLTNESETSLGKKIKFAIRATAKNGQVYETLALDKGGYSATHDYTIKTDCGCGISYEAIDVPLTLDNIKNDQIALIVQSKHHPNLKPVVASIKMAYSQPLEWYYNNGESSGPNGLNKYPIKVYVTESADKKYNLVEVVSFKGEKIGRAKLKKGVNLLINNAGGQGGSSRDRAGNGGNGGNVTVYYKPGLPLDFLTIMNGGGRAYSSNSKGTGRDGLPGKTEKIAQQVNLNF